MVAGSTWAGRRAPRERDRCNVVCLGEVELKLERIVFADVWRISAVFETVVEDAPSAANDQLRVDLVSKAQARGEVCILRISETLAVLIGDQRG